MARLCKSWDQRDDIRLTTLGATPQMDFFNGPGLLGHQIPSGVGADDPGRTDERSLNGFLPRASTAQCWSGRRPTRRRDAAQT